MLDEVLFAIALLLLFWDFIGLMNRWYGLEKHGFTIAPGLMIWRTKRGLHLIDRLAQASKGGWRAYGTVAAVIGICSMVFIFSMLVLNLIFILSQPTLRLPGIVLAYPGLIPGLTIVAWLVAIGSILLVHEFSHGILLRAQGLETKTVGAAILVAIPLAAFVEPNEKQLMRAPVSKRLRMFAAGTMGNFVLAFICLGIILAFLVPKPGVYVYATYKNYPAENFALGTRILYIDNVKINTLDDYHNFMDSKQPGDNILVTLDNKIENVTLAKDPENENKGILGIWPISAVSRWNFANPFSALGAGTLELFGRPVFHPYIYDALIPWFVIDILKWMFILNLLFGLFNLLPARPLDGGYLVEGIIEHKTSKEKARRVGRVLSYIVLALILMNLAPFFLR